MMVPDVHPSLNEWVITPFFQTLQIILLFLLPILTMRSLAEERQNGTYELLLTSPLSPAEIVLGKFLGVGAVVLLMLLASFVFPFVLMLVSDPEVWPVFVGLAGLTLFSLAFSALGIAVSAFTRSQAVAGVVSLVLFLLFFFIGAPAERLGENGQALLQYLSPPTHSEELLKGVMTSTSIVYFASVILVGLFVATRALDAERWR
ncbi:MAG: ABC transporter permease subunit, partial [Bdellovibrionales bacterium]|nr:ABC transporter permease subunit [Bdellovibrionales bacterium]